MPNRALPAHVAYEIWRPQCVRCFPQNAASTLGEHRHVS